MQEADGIIAVDEIIVVDGEKRIKPAEMFGIIRFLCESG